MKNFFKDFKEFLMRGNVLDLAIGVVIGTAFNNITNSLVNNIITPPLGLLLGRIDFKNWGLNLGGSVNIQYGLFIQAVISFIITAFALFLLIKLVARLKRPSKAEQEAEETKKSAELVVLEQIRDSLKNQPSQTSI
jgi:large conductance mechanosensitive channel